MQRVSKRPIRLATLALASMLVAVPVAAQQVDKGEKEVTALGQKVDRTGASADSRHVTAKIVEQWKGTQFKFDAADSTTGAAASTRELTAHDVQSLRLKRLGYGEISILLALTAGQPNASSAKSLSEILAMRQAGVGWGELARRLGYSSLGAVKQSVKATEAGVERVAANERAEKLSKSDKAEKGEKFDKPERIRVEKPERAEKPGR